MRTITRLLGALALALWLGAAPSALAQGTFSGTPGAGQILGNFAAGSGPAAPVNWMASGTSCPSWLSAFQLFVNTSGAPTGDTLNAFDGTQCVVIGTINASTHVFSVSLSSAANSFKGNNTNAPATTIDLTVPQVVNELGTTLAPQTITISGGTITPNFNSNANFNFTVTLNAAGLTFANPTNYSQPQSGTIYLVQDGTGSRTITTWGSAYKFSNGAKPALTTTPGATDVLAYSCTSASYCILSFLANVQ